jgi:hypothetical protein
MMSDAAHDAGRSARQRLALSGGARRRMGRFSNLFHSSRTIAFTNEQKFD